MIAIDCLAATPRTASLAAVRRYVAAREADVGHLAWYAAHIEAYREEQVPQLAATTYLDYAGAALCSRAQLAAATAVLTENLLANPHTSQATSELVAQARHEVLHLFGVSDETHSVVFTSGATHGLQLVGENFAWSSGGSFCYSDESHTSVLGLRECARRAGVRCGTFAMEDLQAMGKGLSPVHPLSAKGSRGNGAEAFDAEIGRSSSAVNLIAVAGESNFSGVKAELSCLASLRAGPLRWRVLLDAAKLACTPGALDLSSCEADFAVVSFYKIFGYPTGLGALIVRHDAAHLLAPGSEPTYFGGGSVAAVSATSEFVVPRANLAERLECGTPHFHGIASLRSQIDETRKLGLDRVRKLHVLGVCREAYLCMSSLKHSNGKRLCSIFGWHNHPNWADVQGPTIAFSLYYADGSPVPYGLLLKRAAAANIMLRAGCHCNAGACQRYLGISDADVRRNFAAGKVCGDDMGIIDGSPTGAGRISFGLFSTLADVRRWIGFLRDEYLNALPEAESAEGTPPNALPEAGTGISKTAGATEAAIQGFPVAPTTPLLQVLASNLGRSVDVAGPGDAVGRVVGLKVYPIKGCGPLRVRRWPLDPHTGALFMDRRWCLRLAPEPEGALSGKRMARMAAVSAKQAPRLTQVRFTLRYRGISGQPELVLYIPAPGSQLQRPVVHSVTLPLSREDAQVLIDSRAEIEKEDAFDACQVATTRPAAASADVGRSGGDAVSDGTSDGIAKEAASTAARWFEELLDLPRLQLVAACASAGTGEAPIGASHFANAPSTLLMVSTASLREFGRLCGLSAPAERFRANLEVDLEPAFAEAAWPVGHMVRAGELELEAAGRCVRCQAVDIDPESGQSSGPSLLAALATARPGGGKGPTFGVLLRRSARPPANVIGISSGGAARVAGGRARRGDGEALPILEVGDHLRSE